MVDDVGLICRVDPKKLVTAQKKIAACVAADPELHSNGQRAFQAYLKSTFMMRDKTVFDVTALDMKAFASSLGLAVPPRVRFLQRQLKRKEEAAAAGKKKKNDGDSPSTSAKGSFMLEMSDSDEGNDAMLIMFKTLAGSFWLHFSRGRG